MCWESVQAETMPRNLRDPSAVRICGLNAHLEGAILNVLIQGPCPLKRAFRGHDRAVFGHGKAGQSLHGPPLLMQRHGGSGWERAVGERQEHQTSCGAREQLLRNFARGWVFRTVSFNGATNVRYHHSQKTVASPEGCSQGKYWQCVGPGIRLFAVDLVDSLRWGKDLFSVIQ